MSKGSVFQHQSRLLVTSDQREKVVDFLQQAYANTMIDEIEFERRLGLALEATTRGDLDVSFRDIPFVPLAGSAVQPRAGFSDRIGAPIMYASALFSGPIGPIVTLLTTNRGTFLHAQAVKATTFQLVMVPVMLVGFFGAHSLGEAPLLFSVIAVLVSGLVWLVWLVTTLVAAIRSVQGKPVTFFSDVFLSKRVKNPPAIGQE